MRSFERLLHADPGFDAHETASFFTVMGPRIFRDDNAAFAFQDRVLTALSQLPGISRVSATTALPLSAAANQDDLSIPGAPGNTGNPDTDRSLVDVIGVRPGYFETMGIRLIEGQAFDSAATSGSRPAVIDRQLAKKFFPTGNPIGFTVPYRGQSFKIIGVVEQARMYDLHQDGQPQLYLRADDWKFRAPYFVLRSEGDTKALLPFIRAVVKQVDPRVALANARTMDEIVSEKRSRERISAVLISGLALGALALVSMGLFGMVSGSVVRRRGELAVRLALGATQSNVLRLVITEGARLISAGLVIGIPGVYIVGEALRGFIVGISPFDATTLTAVAAALILVTFSACYLAARRVTTIVPARLLRDGD